MITTTKLATGYGVKKTEIIDLADSSVSCKPWADADTQYATGVFFDNHLTICGGYGGPKNKCFQIRSNEINPFSVHLKVASYGSSAVMTGQKEFMITGGDARPGRGKGHTFPYIIFYTYIFIFQK